MRPKVMGAWRWLGPFVLLLAWTVKTRAAEVCIGPEARATVRCADAKRVTLGAHQPLAFGVPRPAPPTRPRPLVDPPTSRSLGFLTTPDPRLRRRARRLLVTEIAQVTALLRATPADSPDHARLQRRLAESYVELADRLSLHEATTPNEKHRLAARVAKARRQAIQYYRQLHQEHPRYCRFPRARVGSRSCDDEVLFYWGYELEKAGYPEHARRTYRTLLQRWPGSAHANLARLAFAELSFSAAQTNANLWAEAQKAYEGTITHEPRGSARWGYAQYKLGYVHWHQARHNQAVAAFRAALTHTPSTRETKPLLDAARRDLIPVFAVAGDPAQAWKTFAALSGGSTNDPEPTRRMVEELGRKLLDTGRYDDATTLYASLALRPASPAARCRYQAATVQSTMALHPVDKSTIEAGLRKALQRFAAAKEDDACGASVASLLATTAIAWHIEFAGNPAGAKPVLGTGDGETASAALRLYRLFTTSFTAAMLKRYRFPRLRAQDRPTLSRMHYARADLLWAQADWAACGRAFELARAAAPNGPLAARAIQASALCHLHRGATLPPSQEVLARKKLSPETKTTIEAFTRYTCTVDGADDDHDRIMFARASQRAAAGHYEAAALDYRELAMSEATDGELSRKAANRYLAVLEALRKREARSSCVADARRALPQLRQRHCQSDAALCQSFTELERDLGRREAEALIDRADRGGPQRTDNYRRGAELHLRLWRDHGKNACRNDAEQCSTYAHMLHEAARSFASAHLLARAIDVRKLLVDDGLGLADTHEGIIARRDLGHDHHALGQPIQAAAHYARYAAHHPRQADAAVALAHAISIQARHGDPKKAARLFARRFASTHPRLALEVALDLAERDATQGQTRRALQRLERAQHRFEQSGLVAIDLVVRTEARLGVLHVRLGASDKADEHFGRVRDARHQKAALRRAVRQAAHKGRWPHHGKRFELALGAIGSALDHFAARERARIAHVAGPRDAAWLVRRVQATERAMHAYRPLLELGSPAWAVKTGLALAEMQDRLLADARAVTGADSRPFQRRAKAAYEGCLELGVVHQRFGPSLRQCELWLSEHYPLEYHQRDEIEAPRQLVASP